MVADQIRSVRSFNRAVTQRIGALDSSFLDRGRPLGEARLIYEIGRDGRDVRALREQLALDSGYLSRLLRSLERQGLVRTRRGSGDGRGRHAELTRNGLAELDEYNRRSDEFAQSLLSPLGSGQRERLVAAMAEVERLLRAAAVEIRDEKPDSPAARACLEGYFRELAQRFDGGFDPALTISARPEEVTPPAGCFILARLDGAAIGCGALKVKDASIGEIKRMWVAPSARGLGVGRRILEALEGQARRFGIAILRLETNKTLQEARNLYRTSGYKEVAPFNDEPYAHHWFEKEIESPASPAITPPVRGSRGPARGRRSGGDCAGPRACPSPAPPCGRSSPRGC
jgi:DNA-binding MarR family transcriptional regulator/GNAT superfamily N-acetyltransferase